jgi:hypothetical protein
VVQLAVACRVLAAAAGLVLLLLLHLLGAAQS